MDEELRRLRQESNIRTRLKNTKGMLTRRRNEFEDLAYYYDDYTYDDLLRARHCFEEAWNRFGAALAEYAANGFDLDARYYVERHAYYEQSYRAMADLFDELASGAQDNFPPRSASELYPPVMTRPRTLLTLCPPLDRPSVRLMHRLLPTRLLTGPGHGKGPPGQTLGHLPAPTAVTRLHRCPPVAEMRHAALGPTPAIGHLHAIALCRHAAALRPRHGLVRLQAAILCRQRIPAPRHRQT